MKRPPTFKPDYGIERPEDPPIALPLWLWLLIGGAGVAFVCFLIGLLKGIL